MLGIKQKMQKKLCEAAQSSGGFNLAEHDDGDPDDKSQLYQDSSDNFQSLSLTESLQHSLSGMSGQDIFQSYEFFQISAQVKDRRQKSLLDNRARSQT